MSIAANVQSCNTLILAALRNPFYHVRAVYQHVSQHSTTRRFHCNSLGRNQNQQLQGYDQRRNWLQSMKIHARQATSRLDQTSTSLITKFHLEIPSAAFLQADKQRLVELWCSLWPYKLREADKSILDRVPCRVLLRRTEFDLESRDSTCCSTGSECRGQRRSRLWPYILNETGRNATGRRNAFCLLEPRKFVESTSWNARAPPITIFRHVFHKIA